MACPWGWRRGWGFRRFRRLWRYNQHAAQEAAEGVTEESRPKPTSVLWSESGSYAPLTCRLVTECRSTAAFVIQDGRHPTHTGQPRFRKQPFNVESNRHRSASGGNPNAQHLGVRLTAMLGSHANDIGRLRYSGVVLICTLHKDIFHAGNPVKFCHEIAKPLLGSAIPTHVGGRNRFSFDGQCTELKLVCQ